MAVQIKVRNGTKSQWSSANPVLAEGEMGVETDTRLFKIGNGTSNWNDLNYWSPAHVLSPFLFMGAK